MAIKSTTTIQPSDMELTYDMYAQTNSDEVRDTAKRRYEDTAICQHQFFKVRNFVVCSHRLKELKIHPHYVEFKGKGECLMIQQATCELFYAGSIVKCALCYETRELFGEDK